MTLFATHEFVVYSRKAEVFPVSEEQVLFRNTFTPEAEHFRTAYRCRRVAGSIVTLPRLAFLAVVLVALALVPFLIGKKTVISIEAAAAPACVFILLTVVWLFYIFLPSQAAAAAMRELKHHSGSPRYEALFYEDRAVFRGAPNEQVISFLYHAFTRCGECGDLLLLYSRDGHEAFLLKNGFGDKSSEEFKSFLQQKCPSARFVWKNVRTRSE